MIIVLIGVVVGLVLGLTGAGGSIVATPLLLLLLGLPINEAMGLSLGTVSIAAFTGVLIRATRDQLDWRVGLWVAATGVVFAPVGRWFSTQLPDPLLLTAFTLLSVFLALRMWQQAVQQTEITRQPRVQLPPHKNQPHRAPSLKHLLLSGALCGLLSGLLGVGGGFLIVPLLTLWIGLSIAAAVGTSLIPIALISASGFIYHQLMISNIEALELWRAGFGSIVGILLGTLAAKYLSGPRLQQFFSITVIILMLLTLFNPQQ